MTPAQHEVYLKKIGPQWPELESIREPADARELLIDLCEWQIEELNEKLTEYEENADAIAEKKWNNLGTDETPEGRSIRLYALKCQNAYARAEALLEKRQGKRKSKEERGYREPRRIEDPSRWPAARERRKSPVTDEEIDISWAMEPYPSDQAPTPAPPATAEAEGGAVPPPLLAGEGRGEGLPLAEAQAQGEALPPPHLAGDGRGEGLPLPEAQGLGDPLPPPLLLGEGRGEGLPLLAGMGLRLPPSDAQAEGRPLPPDEVTEHGEETENVRNEPKLDEDTVIAKAQSTVGVTANSVVKSGLDSFGSFTDFSGQMPLRGQRVLAAPRKQATLNQAAPQTDGPREPLLPLQREDQGGQRKDPRG